MTGEMEIPITWKHSLFIWWSYIWRTMLACIGAGFAIGFTVGLIGGISGMHLSQNPELMFWLVKVPVYIVCLPIQVLAMKLALKVRFNGFRIAIVKTNPLEERM